MRSLNVAATGMQAQQTNVDVISNNIANLSTTSFKKQRAEFQDLIYQTQTRAGSTSSDAGNVIPTGIQLGLGVKNSAVYRMHEQGTLLETGNDLDLAFSGRGYFQVELPTGEIAYTRAGSFQRNADGEIVTPEGYIVSPGITIPQNATEIIVNRSGEVLVKIPGQTADQNVGQFNPVTFVNEAGLDAQGQNLFLETEASGAPTEGVAGVEGFGEIFQHFLEQSNVDAVSELTLLITAQRSYELNSRVISTSDEMLQTVSQLR